MLFRLTDNVFVQDDAGASAQQVNWSTASAAPAADPRALTHAIQFFKSDAAGQRVQDITAASVRRAQLRSAAPVNLLAVPLSGEADCVPAGFVAAAPLTRTIADLHYFQTPRRLPLIFDIVDHAIARADGSGYLILTNSDICLAGGFYEAVRAYLNCGFDALIINRRTVGNLEDYGTHPELAEFDVGATHKGIDCFIFPTAWAKTFFKTESCVGVGGVARPLLYNLVAHANRLLFAKSVHLTYHYGNDKVWLGSAFDEYTRHNRAQMRDTLDAISRNTGQFEKLYPFLIAHGEIARSDNPPQT
jgi:hypothetical protein